MHHSRTEGSQLGRARSGLERYYAYIDAVLTPRIIALGMALTVALVVGLVAGLSLFLARPPSRAPVLANTPTILQQFQALSQYVTVKYVMERVVVLEDVKWYGDNRVLLVAHGVVKAGLDLSTIDSEAIEVSGKNVIVRLPAPHVTEVYLDDRQTRVIERSTGMLRLFDKDLEQEARARAVEELERAARYSGILDEARTNARQQLSGLLTGLGYNVRFRE
jgi:hypothetical protein